MPLYDYKCEACEGEFELRHKMDTTARKCPDCGKLKLKREWKQVAADGNFMSPMNPRRGRGKGNTGRRREV